MKSLNECPRCKSGNLELSGTMQPCSGVTQKSGLQLYAFDSFELSPTMRSKHPVAINV